MTIRVVIFALSFVVPFLLNATVHIRPALEVPRSPIANDQATKVEKKLKSGELERLDDRVRNERDMVKKRISSAVREAEKMTAGKVLKNTGVSEGLKHEKMDPSLAKQVRENADRCAVEMRKLAQHAKLKLEQDRETR